MFDLADETGQSCALHKHSDRVLAVSTPKDVPLIAAASYDSSMFLLTKLITDHSDSEKIALTGHSSHVTRVRFFPGFSGANRLASCSYDHTVALWDTENAKQLCSMRDPSATDLDKYHDLAIHNEGFLLATGSQDKLVRLWDQRVGKCVHSQPGHDDFVLSVVFGSDGNTLYSGSKDKTVRLWDLRKMAKGEI